MLSSEVRNYVKAQLSVISDQDISEKSLADGRSGAEVYSIKVCSSEKNRSGCYIVKVCAAVQAHGEENEAVKARRFYDYSSEFIPHLVKVEAHSRIGDKNVIIYSQANNSRMNSVAFSKLDATHFAEYARRASYDLLAVLNQAPQVGKSAEDFFRHLLSKQLDAGGRFRERMETLLNRPGAACVVINGAIYPNPLHFINHLDDWSRHMADLHLFQGALHGDLHGFNLLAADDTYSVIDFDSSDVDSYLLFDQAYLEFSVFFDNSKDNDLKRWSTMLDKLISPSVFEQVGPCEYYLEYLVRNAICGGIADWVEKTAQERRRDDIEIQFLMSRIAAGINFFCKKTCADQSRQIVVLLFISHCLKLLLQKSEYTYNENDISVLHLSSAFTNAENIWEDFLKFKSYIPVLVTDDLYTTEDYTRLRGLCGVRWSMVVDIGAEQKDPVVYKSLLENMKTQTVKRVDVLAGKSAETISQTLNVLSLRRPADDSYTNLWRSNQKHVLKHMERLLSDKPHVPLVFVFDCGRDSLPFRNQLINSLCNLSIPGGTRFVSLRAPLSEELSAEAAELKSKHHWHFIVHENTTLVHVAQSCEVYLSETFRAERSANLPSLNGIYTFSENDLISFNPTIELVYSGCEYESDSGEPQVGFDMSGGGDSLGEAFYKGNEATWNDIANHRDLRLMEDKEYRKRLEWLIKLAEEPSRRIRRVRLIHGAGTGGTTLAKRVLWDLKDRVPCVRLKRYSPKTVQVLLEIYQKTGKRVLMAVERGSTVISDEDLNTLTQQIYAENGKLLLMLITRANEHISFSPQEEEEDKKETNDVVARLTDTMPVRIAINFKETFSNYAKLKPYARQRIQLLQTITGDDSHMGQRSPFFYGFYTFQEEYNLLDRLSRTISSCNDNEKKLLNSLALITIYSQNVCVAFSELRAILGMEDTGDLINIYAMQEELPPALSKLMVIRETGFRLCHRIIAEKVLLILHDPEQKYNELGYVLKQATESYIKVLYQIYGGGNERVDAILKELMIDRAYIDADAQKTKFSPLVEAIPRWMDRKALFELLIENFPENPHYYNHLARLLAFEDKQGNILPQYEDAVEMAQKAIDVATETQNSVSIHRTTRGCIYGQWITHKIKEATDLRKSGRYAGSYPMLIDSIRELYSLARSEFEGSRESTEVHDSFSYFPQINLECGIIQRLVGYDRERTLQQLVEQEPSFKEWYDEHFSIAAELTTRMGERLDNNAHLQEEAQNRLEAAAMHSPDTARRQLINLLQSSSAENRRRSRTLVYGAFVKNGSRWNKLDQNLLETSEQCFRRNVMAADGAHTASDVGTWFELYRRCRYFQATEAQSLIAGYMEDSYRKEYLLFLLSFILYKSGAAGASSTAITTHIAEAHRLARLHGINTARELDFFVSSKAPGCPIVSVVDVKRDGGEPAGLEVFKGRVIEVEHTHGKILLDGLNLEVTFIPNPTSMNSEPQRIFSREDIKCPVTLNLMFSYSGLRGWNVEKT